MSSRIAPTERSCALCSNRTSTMHTLPKNPELRIKWFEFILGTVPKQYKSNLILCSSHFEESDFVNFGEFSRGFVKRLLLKPGAVHDQSTTSGQPGTDTKVCIIQGCSRTQELLAFPKDPVILQQWMLCLEGRLKNPVDSSSRVCSFHFTSDSLAFWQRIRPKQNNSSIQEDMFGKQRRSVSSQCELPQRSVGTQLSKSTLIHVRSKATQTPSVPDSDYKLPAAKTSKEKESGGGLKRSSPFMLDGNTVMSEVVVEVACLLQLFQKCLKCCSDDCSISTGQEGPILHVVQQCWSCGNSREWTSQLPSGSENPETAEGPVVMSPKYTVMDIEQEMALEHENEEADDEEEEEEDDDMTEQDEEEKEVENRKKKKRKSRGSDEEWVPNLGEFLGEASDEESGSQRAEDFRLHQVAWCSDCGEEASASCLRQKHHLLYCCVQCGYRGGYQEPKNTELGRETPIARHQEGTGDVSQAAEGSCSPEVDGNNKQFASSDCPEDAGICSIQGEGSVGNTTRNQSQEDTNSSNQDCSLSIDESLRCQQETNTANQENQNITEYAVYFSDPYSLQSHVEEAHRHKRELCPDCGKFMYRRGGRSVHVCDHKVKPFTCLTCGKKYTSELRLMLHSQVHSEEYRTSCQYCYKTFKHKEDKQQHEETHKGESLKFHCPDCPKRFRSKQRRKVHLLRTHWKDGRYVCKVCGKSFPQANHLKRHEVVHTGVKPYSCELCDRSFNQPGHLKSHMRVHTGERPFKCQDCGLCFNHNVSLKNHVQRKHRPASDGEGNKKERALDLPTASDSSDQEKQ